MFGNKTLKYKSLLDLYMNCFKSADVNSYANRQAVLTLPNINPIIINDLFDDARKIFEDEPVLLELRSPCIVVGDLHGQILDLYRILAFFGMPSSRRKYVFLGDFVDRGEFSVEVIIIVLTLKVIWPDNVSIIRGNHEFQFLCSQCGFMTQMIDFFCDNMLFNKCVTAFNYMPLAARIDRKILCVHGGIGPSLKSLNQICSLRRPIQDFDGDLVDSLVWSDPSDEITEGSFMPSTRGTGYIFNEAAVDDFISNNPEIQMIVRGHECVTGGIEFRFNKKICTVFSASNYCGLVGNSAGILEITGPMQYKERILPPLAWLLRSNVVFRNEGESEPPANSTTKPVLQRPNIMKNRIKGSMSVRGFPASSSLQGSMPIKHPNMSGINPSPSLNANSSNYHRPLIGSQSANLLPKLETPMNDEPGNTPLAPIELKKPIIAKVDNSNPASLRKRRKSLMSNINY
ncbi:hypothetical protein M9Y10_035412 [Tritrichomonas musculus]|uniref:Serine/threonine-protein phosphatase n=1 Tax=Tritrichomonas musculus TaxID=1915356 RepID=A0ABR2KIN3_9EUKA